MEKKTAVFNAAANLKDNQIEVVASTVGRPLRNGCVFAPGAWNKATLKGFTQDGAILVGHDWDDLPIGFPVSAKMEGNDLISVGQFHTTEKGQEARTIAKERMDNGLSVSVSVGFFTNYDTMQFFPNGAAMLAALTEAGEDLTLYDTKAIKAHKYGCELVRDVSELVEWSIVLVGMNQDAKARRVQSLTEGSAHGLDFESHLEISLEGIERAFAIEKMRHEKGRTLSETKKATIAQIRLVAEQTLALGESHSETEPTIEAADGGNDLIARALRHRANAALMR
jgi:hypothetical protein